VRSWVGGGAGWGGVGVVGGWGGGGGGGELPYYAYNDIRYMI